MRLRTGLGAVSGVCLNVLVMAIAAAQTTTEVENPQSVGTTDGVSGTASVTVGDTISPEEQAEGLEAWDNLYRVLSHPRCVNCHVPEDNLPRWSGPNYGKARVHGMHISGGPSRSGAEWLPCATCHGETNAARPHGPPGAPHWQLAPVEQVWWDQSSAAICAQLKDPERNGDRTLAEIEQHIAEDELVRWGWEPGPGRQPAPFSPEEAAAFVRAWAEVGAPCPD